MPLKFCNFSRNQVTALPVALSFQASNACFPGSGALETVSGYSGSYLSFWQSGSLAVGPCATRQ